LIVREIDVVRSLCRRSFKHFVREYWAEVPGVTPLIWNWHMNVLCDEAQRLFELVLNNDLDNDDEDMEVFNVPPGTSKSSVLSILFQAWTWTRMPNCRHMCVSHTEDLVLDLSTKCRAVITGEKYTECFPEIKIVHDQDTKGYFRLTLGGGRFSCTIGGKNPMGFHAHIISVDDPIDPRKALSELEMKNANDYIRETLPSRRILGVRTVMFLIMQRLHEDDPSNTMLKWTGVRHICLPAILSDHVYPESLRKHYDKDGLLEPVRLPHGVLKEREKQLGQYAFAGQYGQNPIPAGGGMFKTARLKTDQTPPHSFLWIVRAWDKAGTSGGGAYTVGVLMAEDKDHRFWILDIVREQLDSAERERLIKLIAGQDGRNVFVILEQEPGSGGKESVENTVRNLAGWRVRVYKVGASEGSKQTRADPFSVQVNGGNVYLKAGNWHDDFIDELKHFPLSRYKDQVDACSMAFNMITKKKITVGGIV